MSQFRKLQCYINANGGIQYRKGSSKPKVRLRNADGKERSPWAGVDTVAKGGISAPVGNQTPVDFRYHPDFHSELSKLLRLPCV